MTSKAARSPVETLLDKQAITEVLYRYCRGCDRADEETMRACFHPGSTHRHGGFEGTSADFCTMGMKIIRAAKMTKHMLTNVLIELDGDMGFSECHYLAYHREVNRETGEEEDCFSGGRYLDRFECRNGEWRIVQRVGLIDYERYEPSAQRRMKKMPPAQISQRFPSDELYRSFMPGAQPPRDA